MPTERRPINHPAGICRSKFARRAVLNGIAVAVCIALNPGFARAGDTLTAPEAFAQASAGRIVLIDVRSPREWRDTGVPAGARTVTIHQGSRGFLRGILQAAGGDKNRPIALICARGNRSSRGKRFLEANGFSKVIDVPEGMIGRGRAPGWIARKLPTRPCAKC